MVRTRELHRPTIRRRLLPILLAHLPLPGRHAHYCPLEAASSDIIEALSPPEDGINKAWS